MHVDTGVCLKSEKGRYYLSATLDCFNPPTIRWKLLNDGKQLCDLSSNKCMSVSVGNNRASPSFLIFDTFPVLENAMLRDGDGTKNCQNCWVPSYTQHVYAVKNEIRFIYGRKFNATSPPLPDHCLTAFKPSDHPSTRIEMRPCGDRFRNQSWCFASFE